MFSSPPVSGLIRDTFDVKAPWEAFLHPLQPTSDSEDEVAGRERSKSLLGHRSFLENVLIPSALAGRKHVKHSKY